VSYHLKPLDPDETAAYINFRLDHAALGDPLRFPPDASDLVHQVSGGVPRIINVLCDATLVFGYAEERRTIDRATIEEVVGELEETGIVRRRESVPHTVDAARPLAGTVPAPVRETVPPALAPAATPISQFSPRVASAGSATPVPLQKSVVPAPPASHPDLAARVPAPAERIAPPAAPAATVLPASATARQNGPVVPPPVAAMASTESARDRSLAAARDAAVQSTQLAASRSELAGERESITRRQRELAAKEQALLARERQIAEQRRIMGEEYRLLRQTQPAAAGTRPYSPTRASTPYQRPTASPASLPALTFWQRLFRMLTGGHAVRS
jgi:hypothetical protein